MTTFIANAANLAVTPAGAITSDNAQRAMEQLDTTGKHTIWVPAVAMYPTTTNGAAWSSEQLTNTMAKGLLFSKSTEQYAQFHIAMPKSWNEDTFSAQFFWTTADDDSSARDVIWSIQAMSLSDGNTLGTNSFGAAASVVDTALLADTLRISIETGAGTVGNTPAEGDYVVFRVFRDADAAGDTLDVDAILLGVKLYYTTNAVTDD